MKDNLHENIPTNHISATPSGEMGQGEYTGISTYSPILTKARMMRRKKNINTDKDQIKQNIKEDALDQELVKLFSEFESPDLLVEAAEKVSRTVKGPKSDRNIEHLRNLRQQAIARAKAKHGGKLPDPNWSKETKEVVRQDHEKAVSQHVAKQKEIAAQPVKKEAPWQSVRDQEAFNHHVRQYALTGDQEHRKHAIGYHTALFQHHMGDAIKLGGDIYHQGANRAWVKRESNARMAQISMADQLHNPKKPGFFGRLKKKLFGEDVDIEDSEIALLLIEEIDNIVTDKLVNEHMVMKARNKFIR